MSDDDFRLDDIDESEDDMPILVWHEKEGKYLNTSTGRYHSKFTAKLFEMADLVIIED